MGKEGAPFQWGGKSLTNISHLLNFQKWRSLCIMAQRYGPLKHKIQMTCALVGHPEG
uniref:Uncharacterized protein n=1 Tax=Anguilla anguilla TaxID=7936 RepID=A0A0E9SBW1_ANGAN